LSLYPNDIPGYLGPYGETLFTSVYNPPPVGVAFGLSVSSSGMGGSILPIEVVADHFHAARVNREKERDKEKEKDAEGEKTGSGRLRITGRLGETLKESVDIAMTFAKNFLAARTPDNAFFTLYNLHMHLPEGAIQKDGPSAGVTVVTALLSIAMNRSILPLCAMTGEVNLHGHVLPVGGIKEKLMAAKREGLQVCILPKGNEKDYLRLEEVVRGGIAVHFASHYSQVFDVVFPQVAQHQHSTLSPLSPPGPLATHLPRATPLPPPSPPSPTLSLEPSA
jgi:ATP-dependent Lon protease